MPQEKGKISNGVGSGALTNDSRGPTNGSDAENQRTAGEGKSDAERQEDLESADMPELKDQELEVDEQVSLDLSEPSPEVMEYARKELGETDEVKCQTLQELRDMIYGNFESGRCPETLWSSTGRGFNAVKIVRIARTEGEEYNREVLNLFAVRTIVRETPINDDVSVKSTRISTYVNREIFQFPIVSLATSDLK